MAMTTSRCPFCGFEGRVPDAFLGKQIKCRKCGKSFSVAGSNSPSTPGTPSRKRSRLPVALVLLVLLLTVGGAAGIWFMNNRSDDLAGDSRKVVQGKTSSNAVANDLPPRTELKSPPKESQPVQTQAMTPPPKATQPQVTQREPEPKPKGNPAPEPKKALPVRQMQETIKKVLRDNANDPDSIEIASYSEPLEVEIERPTESNLDQLLGADGMPRKKNWKPGAIVTCKYRGKNAFGAKVLDEVVFVFLLEKDGLKFFGPKSLARNVPENVQILEAVSRMGIVYREAGSGWRPVTKELWQAYQNDGAAADKKYKGETFMVEGEVVSVREFVDPANNGEHTEVSLKYGEPPTEIRCDFSGFPSLAAGKLKKGTQITLVGTCDGKVDGKLKFNNCKLELPD